MSRARRIRQEENTRRAGRPRAGLTFTRADAIAAVVLVALGAAAFWPVLGYPFLNWDDHAYVSENPWIRSLAPAAVARLFSPAAIVVANWAPATLLSYALDHASGGLDPRPYHRTNLLLHLASGVLAYFLCRGVLGRRSAAWTGALLFLVHPIQVESVAWVAERKNVLSLALALAAFLLARSARNARGAPATGRHAAALLLFAAALLAKATVVVLPLLLVAAWMLLDGDTVGRALRRAAPYFALALAAGLITLAAQHGAGGIKMAYGGNFALNMATMARVFWLGVALFLDPRRLSAIYDPPVARSLFEPTVLLAAVALGALIVLLVRARRRAPRAVFFAAWYLIGLLPVANLVPLPHLLADRFLYVSSIGAMGLAALGLMALAGRFAGQARAAIAIATAGTLVGAGLIAATRAQLPVWGSSELLWRDTLRHAPNAAVAHGNLGEVLANRGDDEEALAHYRRALELRPDYHEARVNMANALARLGRTAAAESLYATALSGAHPDAETYVNLGIVRRQAGDRAGARAAFEAALAADPRSARALNQLAVLAAEEGDREGALACFDRAIAVDPVNAEAYSSRALILGRLGRPAEARASVERAIALRPDYAPAHFNLGIALLAAGDVEGARRAFARAVERDPALAARVPPPAR